MSYILSYVLFLTNGSRFFLEKKKKKSTLTKILNLCTTSFFCPFVPSHMPNHEIHPHQTTTSCNMCDKIECVPFCFTMLEVLDIFRGTPLNFSQSNWPLICIPHVSSPITRARCGVLIGSITLIRKMNIYGTRKYPPPWRKYVWLKLPCFKLQTYAID